MQDRTYLSPPHMGENEFKYVKEAFETNWIAPVGPHLNKFEEMLQENSGVPYAAALSSGTAAIHLALIILGVSRGDTVICSSFTFAGSCNPIVYQGAEPVFVDSEEETWNMDPSLLEEAIKSLIKQDKKPKAIIYVHLYGMPAKVDEINAIARKYQIPTIEDAAEALGSKYRGKALGSFGDFGVFSFNGNKIITTSGGGALVSEKHEWVEKAKFLATQARDPGVHYEHSEIGYNYRLSNVCAGIGRGQMEVLASRVKRRREIFERYRQSLSDIEALDFPKENKDCYSNRWLTTMLISAGSTVIPEQIRLSLEEHNIESRPLWKPMHQQPVFKDCPKFVNGLSDRLFATGICLPSGSSISNQRIDEIIEIIRGLF